MPLILTRTPSSLGSSNRMSQPITPPVPPDPPPIIPDYPGYSGLGYIIVAKLPITAQITTIIEVRDYDDE